ncbi:multi antimicrobial extrusion protein MatE [Lederbergia citrea]|uniref:Multi antimicrobial extrusion protein MatE n=1 Tax=Lederbergia citrea TaxID=2833581 RepID=A0A942Z3W7_9BACI|nr:multi antimicrobial extrusion protein MatE [Lederbergia citrea]MBS4178462.1 multi antimicrobial extrusion protein MatE [Lederbergia citrea]MBS4205134.1 multi antimicrobial extrusion protein MatE [Lederbergia citrea]MBS4223004.1 multi antimicrobial extrusion protein MatE [Lederbergia citrea]
MKIQQSTERNSVSFRTLFNFFIPLGISASLVTISHVIINGTLARAPNPAVVIASYSVAMSLFAIFERCAVILRQTCATLARDKHSFKLVSRLTVYLLSAILLLSLIIGYSSIGELFFSQILGVKEHMLGPTMSAYRVLMFVTIFSGIRCLFQGVIISNLRTKWLTIGMAVRLIVMAILSWVILKNGWMNHGYVGAYIFLSGMVIEALVSVVEGRQIIKKMPTKNSDHPIVHRSQVNKFYLPLLLASLIAVIISPAINAVLGSSGKAEIAIASYAIAFSVLNLLLGFSSYIHQIVINFYEKDAKIVHRFTLIFSLIPTFLLVGIAYSPLGVWVLQSIMGVSGELLNQSLLALKFFIIFTLFFPWLDYVNGVLMLKGQTKVMSFSQAGNVIVTIIALLCVIFFLPNGGGLIGALAQSIGVMTETLIALIFLRRFLNKPIFGFKKKKIFQQGA